MLFSSSQCFSESIVLYGNEEAVQEMKNQWIGSGHVRGGAG